MKNLRINNKWIRIPLKILLWLLVGVFGLVILVVIALQLPPVQNYVAQKAVNFLHEKIKTQVTLESISIGFPKTINIKGLYLEDQQSDTLLYAHNVYVGVNMIGLLKNKLDVRSVRLNGVTGRVYRQYPDTTFNYSFIIDAFASAEQQPQSTDTTAAFIIRFDEIDFTDLRLQYKDTLSGVNARVYVGKLETSFREFDIEKMSYKLKDLLLENSAVSYLQTPPLVKSADTSTSVMPDLDFRKIALVNLSVNYQGPAAGNALEAKIGNLTVLSDTIDMVMMRFALNNIDLSDSDIKFLQTKPQQFDTIIAEVVQEQGIEKEIVTPEWEFTLKNLNLNNNNLAYRDYDSVAKTQGIDFDNLVVTDFNFESSEMYVTPGKIKLSLDHFSFAEKSGFMLKEFASKISYDTTNITLADLIIETPNTSIKDHLEVSFTSITGIADSIEKLQMNINLQDTRISFADVLYFMPELANNPKLNINRNEVIDISGGIRGSLEDLMISNFYLDNNKSTNLSLSGSVRNAMHPDRMYASVNDFKFRSTRNDILSYVRRGVVPETISIPDYINATGNFTGYIKNFNAAVDLKSAYGNLDAKVKMDPSKGNRETNYVASLDVDRIDLGKLLMQPDTLGPVSLSLDIKGTGMEPDRMNAEVKATVHEAFYNKYIYKDLNLEGFLVNRSFHGEIWMNDENLDFNYTGYINAHPDSLAFIFDFVLNGADLMALNLSPTVFKARGSIRADLAKRYGPNPLGKLKLYDVQLITQSLDCPLDSLVVESTYDFDSSYIEVRSKILNASFKGDIVLQHLPATLISHLNQYFAFSETDTTNLAKAGTTTRGGVVPLSENPVGDTATKSETWQERILSMDGDVVPQNFGYSITVQDPNLFCENILPGLKRFTPLAIFGNYNSDEMALALRADIPMIDYNGIIIDSLYINVNSNRQELAYDFNVAEISNPTLAIEKFDLKGSIADDEIIYNVNAQKADTFNVLKTSGSYAKRGNDYLLIMDEPLVLNNTVWNIDPDNVITFSDKGLDAQRVILTGEDQLISIITQPGDDVPLKVSFENFRLANLSLIVEKEKELVRGELNGHFVLFNVNGVSAFTSDLVIDSLRFMAIPIGDITLLADNSQNPEQFDVNLKLLGFDNDLTVNGYYLAQDSVGQLSLDVDINRLNMAAVEPFTFGQVSRMSGFVDGSMNVRGTTEVPDVTGQLRFNDVAFNAPYANTYLRMQDNTIDIANQRMIFNDLTLTDTLNNNAVIKGYADFSDLQNLLFDLRINTTDFLAMNSSGAEGDMPLYGKVLLDSDIHFTGSPSSPVIDMKVQLDNGTRITYVMPESQMTLNESEGIVIFTDSLDFKNDIVTIDSLLNTNAGVQGITLNASITFEPEAVLKMLIDPVSGDSLYVSGDGTLNFSLDPGGQMNLTGRYEINEGGYNITLNELIKREFTIREGSSITWTGDIMEAITDLTAVYTVRTSPLTLMESQTIEESERNTYRNTLTFLVFLKITGPLTKPEISFDIELPENQKGAMGGDVNTKLTALRADESQLNKQVFALLALGRFLGQDPFETGNAPLTAESATRASASKILTQQFSALSEKYIKGVDLDIGVNSFEEYSESGEQEGRTQLQLGLSKEFLNDRIIVQVGGNVELEGEQARSSTGNDRASEIAGNVNIEYKLTPNGRYRLKGFRRTEYEDPIEGEVINTGIGFSYSRDFRRMRQLFWSKERLQEFRKKRLSEEIKEQEKNNDKQ